MLPKLKIAHAIGKAVWDQRGDTRDVISIGKLVRKNDGPKEVEQISATMIKYGEINNNHNNTRSWGQKFEMREGANMTRGKF